MLEPFTLVGWEDKRKEDMGAGDNQDPRQRQRKASVDLEAVVGECAQFGFELFAHPCSWRVVLEPEQIWRDIIIFPGLEKVCGADGRTLGSPMVLVRPVVVDATGV